MWSMPVTLGGGMTMEKAGRLSLTRSGSAVKQPLDCQNSYHLSSTEEGSYVFGITAISYFFLNHRWTQINTDGTVLVYDPLVFKARVVEVHDQSYSEAGDFQIIQHWAAFTVGDLRDNFGVCDDLVVGNQIGDEFADVSIFIANMLVKSYLKRKTR